MTVEVSLAHPAYREYGAVSAFAKGVYLRRLDSVTAAQPEVFVYAQIGRVIVGCIGLYRADRREQLLIERFLPDALTKVLGSESSDRTGLAELGTRAIDLPEGSDYSSIDISIALLAVLIPFAYETGIRHLAFISNPLALRLGRALGFAVESLGDPDVSREPEEFKRNMKGFLSAKQTCFSARIGSVNGCTQALTVLARKNIFESDRFRRAA